MKHRRARATAIASIALAFSVALAGSASAAGKVYNVNSVADVPDATSNGICDTGAGNVCNGAPCCTLRAAIMEANLDVSGQEVTINLPAGTYYLTIPIGVPDGHANGDLNILEFAKVRIVGAGSDLSIIDANHIDRAMAVEYGAVVTLSDLRLQGGRPPASASRPEGSSGGAIYNDRGDVTLVRCLVRDNQVSLRGGGIMSSLGSLTVSDSAIRINSTPTDSGGGIYTDRTNVSIARSAVYSNTAYQGGGIYQNQGSTNIVNSTISLNVSAYGGGLFLDQAVGTKLNNVTVAMNTASASYPAGAAMYFYASSAVLSNSIFTNNDMGCEATNSVTSNGYNMVIDPGTCSITGGVITDKGFTTLQPLAYYGGLTATHALNWESYAHDAGNPSGCLDPLGAPLTTDQRGVKRIIGAHCDLGAFEVEPIGDANGDGVVDVGDVFYLVNFLFAGGQVPRGRANVDGVSGIDVSDVFYLINFLFAGGKPPG
jgi:hypothetical protein